MDLCLFLIKKKLSCSRFKQSKTSLLISQMICKFLGDFWEEIVFLKGLVKFGEIRNIEDLICF